jgi:hypothetical protein
MATPKDITQITDLVNMSLKGIEGPYMVNFKLKVGDTMAHAYEAHISYRDILLYTDKGTVTCVVDSYGDKNTFEIFDWDFD